ncbi:D-cysteine desulfhydrase family protein [Streptomyces sp. AK02-01A]|uniref:D-cysteine desulfhydrase family protein n=1 Tax=Streptomyces sp. AK02-01A TaxID=3028648 RepID=UPI0029AA2A63|nr:D-cysteine desulfhydrase family protein [Streptomyces sp. AK02-01A]MDX3852299.1 D-cysteine desulfhydrase family protein [Streptomyces sp. AK02-01A]
MTAAADHGAPEPVPLASRPTPLEPAPRLARALGLGPDDLWLKRDDLIGLGGGGNKVRKLEWLCGAALAEGAGTLVTSGAAQSNHARLTAAAGARLGLDVVLVLAGTPDGAASGNVALDGLLGAEIVWAGDVDETTLAATLEEVVARLRSEGAAPALIPFGGSSVTGARGYAECGRELLAQAPDLSLVVTAVGSGGTMAGLVHTLGAERVLGVHCGAVPDPARTVRRLVAGLSAGGVEPAGLRLRLDQVGDGYASLTEPVKAAMRTTARTEGIILDPIYTGRAMAGLMAAAEDGEVRPGRRTVFLHSGGLPGFFGHGPTVGWARSGATGG